jgi:hypothetical protein
MSISLVRMLWWPADSNECRFGSIIANGGQAIVVIYREGVELNYFLLYFIDSAKTLRLRPRPTPCKKAPRGAVFFSIKTMPLEGETAPSWWGCLCACVQLATRLPIGSFFILARMDLGVTLLSPSGGFLRFPLMHAFHSRVSKIRCLKLLLGGDLMILPSGSLGYLVEGKILDLKKNDSNVDESCNRADRCSKTEKNAYCKRTLGM